MTDCNSLFFSFNFINMNYYYLKYIYDIKIFIVMETTIVCNQLCIIIYLKYV